MRVQAFAAQLAVERFDEGIVCGLARAGEVQDHTALVSPQIHVTRDKFTAIVHSYRLRVAEQLFTMFAEDSKLIPEESFTGLLKTQQQHPEHLAPQLSALWQAMDKGEFAPALGVPV